MKDEKEYIEEKYLEIVELIRTNGVLLLTEIHNGIKSKSSLLEYAENLLIKLQVPSEHHKKILEKVENFLFGYSKLQPLIDDDNITDIRCQGYNNIEIKSLGKRYKTNISFSKEKEYKNFVSTVAIKNSANLSYVNATQTFTDILSNEKFRLRFNIVTDFLTDGQIPFMHIRKIPKKKYTLEDLCTLEHPMMDSSVAKFIENQVKNNQSMIICGPNASGKTYLLNAAIEAYPHDLSGFCTQESEELFTNTHPDFTFLHTVVPSGDSKVEYSLKDELKVALMTDNDLIIVGEVKDGPEALSSINAAFTGSASWLTIHSVNSQEAVQKLADYAMYEAKYQIEKIYKEMSYMHMVIYVENFRVKEISIIDGYDDNIKNLKYTKIYDYENHTNQLEEYMLKDPDMQERKTLEFTES